MSFLFVTIRRLLIPKIFFLVLVCLSSLFLPSCFTGIESTKKISLSREDKKLTNPTPEELFMAQLKAEPLKEWANGKRFIASDDKALLAIVPQSGIIPIPPDSIKGKILEFAGVEPKMNASGNLNVALLFSDGIYTYSYDTGKEFDYAMENLFSDQIPMLIDEDMVTQARRLLVGNKFFTRSSLWYDDKGNRIDGQKFVEVTVTDVQPGNLVFPLNLAIRTKDGNSAHMFMNFGNAGNESRGFNNLFSLSDIKKHYPHINAETWDFISNEKVKEGMTKEECRLALGNPSDASSGHDYSQTLDIWSYENGKVLWFEDGRLVKIRQ